MWCVVFLLVVIMLQIVGDRPTAETKPVRWYEGGLKPPIVECVWDVGEKLSIYAMDTELCSAFLLLPVGHPVRLDW